MLFGIMGLQEFSGLVYNYCRVDPKPITLANGKLFWKKSEEFTPVCSMPDVSGLYKCPDDLVCGSPIEY